MPILYNNPFSTFLTNTAIVRTPVGKGPRPYGRTRVRRTVVSVNTHQRLTKLLVPSPNTKIHAQK